MTNFFFFFSSDLIFPLYFYFYLLFIFFFKKLIKNKFFSLIFLIKFSFMKFNKSNENFNLNKIFFIKSINYFVTLKKKFLTIFRILKNMICLFTYFISINNIKKKIFN